MEGVRFDDAREFRKQADPLLLAGEAANNLILGVTQTVIDHPNRFDSFLGWVMIDEDKPTAAAAQTAPYNLRSQGIIATLRRVFVMVSSIRGFVEVWS